MTTTRVEDARQWHPSLKQSKSVCSYVNAFQKLVMQISDMMDRETFRRFKEDLNGAPCKAVTKEDCKTYDNAVWLVLCLDALDTKFSNMGFSNTTIASKPSQTPTPMEIDAIHVGAPPTSIPKFQGGALEEVRG